MRMIKLNSAFLMEALRGKAAALNLPDDVELLDIKCDLFSGQVVAIVRSDKFEDVAESYPIPELTVASDATSKPEAPAAAGVLPNVKPVQKIPVRAQQDTGTGGIEKEFSPEQRELLNFAVEGDYVIVKPTQFLKEEWNEINDVVKSLGGRWVKGDIISYWEIPLP
ncbi:MAG: hypothetical protein NWE99_04845 [Candidatus Bathyarchaeota archaeon]|nr:hypothetical protein [Candidatus Bathyarchaeota archaeon]